MGIGDDLMFLGECQEIHTKMSKTGSDGIVIPVNNGRFLKDSEWSPTWQGHEWLRRNVTGVTGKHTLKEIRPGGNRPYIHHWEQGRIVFMKYTPRPARLMYSGINSIAAYNAMEEHNLDPKEFVIANPDVKNTTLADNKDWGFDRWQKLTDLLHERGITVVRMKPPSNVNDVSGHVRYDAPELKNAINVSFNNIMDAFCFATFSSHIFTTEGGLHHAAAGFSSTKTFVIFGGVISPDQTGYKNQVNFYSPDQSPCGSTVSCPHCREALNSITPEAIIEHF